MKNKLKLFEYMAEEFTKNADIALQAKGTCSFAPIGYQGITSNTTKTGIKRQITSIRALLLEIEKEMDGVK